LPQGAKVRKRARAVAAWSVGVLEIAAMIGAGKASRQAARDVRLKAALRENLKRRKAQARARASSGSEPASVSQGATENEAEAPDFRRNPGRD
jgi:hypothetical protein